MSTARGGHTFVECRFCANRTRKSQVAQHHLVHERINQTKMCYSLNHCGSKPVWLKVPLHTIPNSCATDYGENVRYEMGHHNRIQ